MRRLLRQLFKSLFHLLFKVKLIGFSHFPTQPHIIAPNHRFILDAPLLIGFLPMDFSAMGKASLARSKVFGPIFRHFQAIPVERDGQDIGAIRQAITTLQRVPLIIFPEGTTTNDGGRLPAKPGLGLIAKQAAVPIVPLTIKTNYRLFGTIELIAHEPVRVTDFGFRRYSSQTYHEIGERVLDIVYQRVDGGAI